MPNPSTASTRMRIALACVLALIIGISMGHAHSGLVFADQHHASSAADSHGHPADHDHGISADCTACPSSACSFLVTASVNAQTTPNYDAVVFFTASQPLHSANRDGPLRPPNGLI